MNNSLIEIYQTDQNLFEVISYHTTNGVTSPSVILEGTRQECESQFPEGEVFTCFGLGGEECTILQGEATCRICES
jgi:hypothetical protein